jgi:Pleckstrin homology domain
LSRIDIGYAKRYFTLSASTGELSYSQSSHNPILRGTIPLALAALNIDYSRKEFILDSGADIWHLRATSESGFEEWKTRLEEVWLKAIAGKKKQIDDALDGREVSGEWKQVERLVERLDMMKEFVHGMVVDVAQETAKDQRQLIAMKSADNLRESAKTKEAKQGRNLFRKREKLASSLPLRDTSVIPGIGSDLVKCLFNT